MLRRLAGEPTEQQIYTLKSLVDGQFRLEPLTIEGYRSFLEKRSEEILNEYVKHWTAKVMAAYPSSSAHPS